MIDLSDRQQQIAFASLIGCVQRPGPTPEAERLLQPFDDSLRLIVDQQSSGALTDWVILKGRDTIVTVIGGTDNVEQAVAYTLATLKGPISIGKVTVNEQFYRLAQAVRESTQAARDIGDFRRIYVGHSYGGAAASILACGIGDQGGTQGGSVLTFGSPKPFGESSETAQPSGGSARFVNDGDPVPDLPADFLTPAISAGRLGAQTAVAGFALASRSEFNFRWYHNSQPLRLSESGVTSFGGDSRFGLSLSDLASPGTIGGRLAVAINAHSIGEYEARLRRLPGLEVASVPSKPVTALAVTQPLGGVFPMPSLFRPPVIVQINPFYKPKAQRIGTEFWVVWQSLPVMRGGNLSRARTLARRLNALLFKLETATEVKRANLLSALDAYLTAASLPGNKFNPVMHVT